MSLQSVSGIEQLNPREAFNVLRETDAVALIDVRTMPEWNFVGVPDLSGIAKPLALVQWRQFPDMSINDSFVSDVTDQLGGVLPETLLFICRSGARSQQAAEIVNQFAAKAGSPIRCINVTEGFEGDLDEVSHRGGMNGWKAHELPWRQT